jgi:site-specific recombinase XerD
LNRLSEKAGVTGRHNAHSFRHALARRLLFNGADMGTVSRLLGHSNIETTHDFYAIWTERELWLRYRQFGGLI